MTDEVLQRMKDGKYPELSEMTNGDLFCCLPDTGKYSKMNFLEKMYKNAVIKMQDAEFSREASAIILSLQQGF